MNDQSKYARMVKMAYLGLLVLQVAIQLFGCFIWPNVGPY